MKKIIAFLMALVMGLFIMMNNCFKADAALMSSSLLAYLLQACAEILVGSGTVTQSQFNSMSTTEIFDTTKVAAPNIDFSALPKDPRTALELFLLQTLPKVGAPVYALEDFAFRKFIMDEKFNIPTVNPELKGYGAMATVKIYSKSDNTLANTAVYFGDYGIIQKDVYAEIYGDKIIRQYIEGTKQTEKEYSGKFTCGGVFGDDNYIYAETTFIGDWRYPDGTTATDMLTFVDEIPEAIGTVDIDGTTYDVNGDGTVTIGDETIPINDDGSVTVDDKPYYPDYDLSPYPDTALVDLITNIINNIDVTEDTNTDELVEDIALDVPQELAESKLSSFVLPKTILTVFPFCIPMDFYNGIKLLGQKPEAPRFEVPFEIPQYKSFPGFKKMIVIDFSEYYSAFAVVRWTMFTIFMFGLCFITFKIVKGI